MGINIRKRRSNSQPASSFDVSPAELQQVQAFNKSLRFAQGFFQTLAQGANTVSINLTGSGKMLLGINIIPASAQDITQCLVDFDVNNKVLLKGVNASNLNPNFVQGMIFLPTPQPLFGNDNFTMTINKQNVGAAIITTNIFYVPRV